MKKPIAQQLWKAPCDESGHRYHEHARMTSAANVDITGSVRRRISILLALLLFLTAALPTSAESREGEYFFIAKNIELLGEVYRSTSENYVDSIDVAEFMYAGIDGMLESLDPYTVFLDETESAELVELTSGQYAGIGVRLAEIGGEVYILSVFEDSPASKAGLRIGDRIESVGRKRIENKGLDEVKNIIKGPPGTGVTLTVERYGEKRKKRIRLVREEVRVSSIRYAGLFGDIGYFEMHSFGKRSTEELQRAIDEMRALAKTRGRFMNAAILDLRNNPGGLLEAAIDVTGLFIDKGSRVVSIIGRDPEKAVHYQTKDAPLAGRLPLAVLINKKSASASEIVAGAIQELDRGVIIGERSFGKGLVQSVITLPYDCKLKMTTAKYYTPSGRLIQKELRWAEGDREVLEPEEKQDNREVFYTHNKRKVYGGGGILPDIRIQPDSLGDYEAALQKKGMLFRYANQYRASNDTLPKKGLDKASLMVDFQRFLTKEGFSYKTEPEVLLEELHASLEENGKRETSATDALIASLEKEMKTIADKKRAGESETIALALGEEIMRHFDEDAAHRSAVERDPVVKKALAILRDSSEYRKILSP